MDVLSCNCADGLTGPAGPDGLLSLPGVARVWVMRTGTSPSAVSFMLPPGTGYCATDVLTHFYNAAAHQLAIFIILSSVPFLSQPQYHPTWAAICSLL